MPQQTPNRLSPEPPDSSCNGMKFGGNVTPRARGLVASMIATLVKLVEIKKRHPNSYIDVEYEHGATFKQIGGAILMIQETGIFPRAGFLIEPRAVTDNK